MKMTTSGVWLFAAIAGLGCMRTTSLGHATAAADAQADADASSADGPSEPRDRDGATSPDSDAAPIPDAPADLPREAPIIGGGRDASSDGTDGPDAADAV
jgi:hypothetical protein